MITFEEQNNLKAESRRLIHEASVPPLRFTLFYFALRAALGLVGAAADALLGADASTLLTFPDVLASLAGSVLFAGYVCYILGARKGLVTPYRSLFDGVPFAGRVILLQVLQGLLLGIGLSLFVVPGIVLALSYSLSLFHLCESPELSVLDAMRLSRVEMSGRKWDLFRLLFSFWPLLLPAITVSAAALLWLPALFPATAGGDLALSLCFNLVTSAAQIYLMPYLCFTMAAYYERVRSVSGILD